MADAIRFFRFEGNRVRALERDGEPWFVAKDVCDVLGIVNSRGVVSTLDEDERSTIDFGDGNDNRDNPFANIINEFGLYTLIMRSDKSEACRFRKWITSEVMPALRERWSYNICKDDARDDAQHDVKRSELAMRSLAIQEKRANVWLAKILQRMIEHPAYSLSQEHKQILAYEITRLITGREYVEMLPSWGVRE